MSIHKSRLRPVVADSIFTPTTPYERLRHECGLYIQPLNTHWAGGGSFYILAGDIKVRIANHGNISKYRDEPDYNIVGECVSPVADFDGWAVANPNQFDELLSKINYPNLVKKTVLAKHLGLTVPKLKKVLTPECYEDVCENEAYPNTYTEYVDMFMAVDVIDAAGITTRLPIYFGVVSEEDYDGY